MCVFIYGNAVDGLTPGDKDFATEILFCDVWKVKLRSMLASLSILVDAFQ